MRNHSRVLKKLYWYVTAKYTSLRNPINNNLIFLGITGTDGKTTTSSFLYEIAKSAGYKPFLLTTVSAKFENQDVELQLMSSSFLTYSIKKFLSNIRSLKLLEALKSILLLDKIGFQNNVEEHRTTPLASEIRNLIKLYESKGANFFILEVTSHALDQKRVYGIKFDSVVFTNITNEHLDYHGSWEAYAKAKSLLIRQLKNGGTASINKDDEKSFNYLKNVIEKLKVNSTYYSVKNLEKIKQSKFVITTTEISNNETAVVASPSGRKTVLKDNNYFSGISLFGDYNINNALAAFSCFNSLKVANPELIAKSLINLKNITGRMNFLFQHPTVIVDFAHTPNAFEKALSSVKELVKENGRLWVIFGCAGLRDQYKRPEMGKFAYDYADNILITAEDPRSESLHEINKQIIQGFRRTDDQFTIETYYPELKYEELQDGKKFIARFDEPNPNSRRNAIKFAIDNANKNDVILILGKGHEKSICFGTKEYPWNDIEETKSLILSKSTQSNH